MKKIFDGKSIEEAHGHFVRFGKGNYQRRFLINLNKGKKIKVRASFELANDLVKFVEENNTHPRFSGKVLTKSKIEGITGRKKAGGYVYEITNNTLEKFNGAYCFLLDSVDVEGMVLKIKKSLPKPGKRKDKIDDKFCMLDLDEKYLPLMKETFFWDVPENAKKISVEHELIIDEIILPEGVEDPTEMRKLAKRKGKIVRKVIVDGKEKLSEKEFTA